MNPRRFCPIALFLFVSVVPLFAGSTTSLRADSSTPPPYGKNNVWYRSSDSEIAFVFVHGLFSDSASCWLAENRSYWPTLVQDDPLLGDTALFLGGFYTHPSSGDYDISDAAEEVFDALRLNSNEFGKTIMDYPYLLFVTHSTGGIVARHMLYHHRDAFKGKVVGLMLIASPSAGSQDATRFEGLSRTFGNAMTQQLSYDSQFLRELDNNFRTILYDGSLPNLIGIELIETHFIVRWLLMNSRVVVDRSAAGRYFGRIRQVPDTDHFSIAKPTSHDHPSHQHLRDFFVSAFLEEINTKLTEDKANIYQATEHLNDAFRALRSGSELEALQEITDADALCTRAGDARCLGEVNFMGAKVDRIYGRPVQAYNKLRKAREHFEQSGYEIGVARVLRESAELERVRGNLVLAAEQLLEARRILRGQGGS